MRCEDLYVAGCDQPVEGPGWLHPEHWASPPSERPTEPALRVDVPERVIRMLAGSSESSVRAAVAAASQTPDDVVDQLLADRNMNVFCVALRRTGSAEELRRAAGDPRWHIRRDVAMNPRCPQGVLERLSHDTDDNVRNRVVCNPATPDRLVDAAVGDPDPHVRWWALRCTRNAAIIQEAADSTDSDRQWVASNPNCPPEVLARLAVDPFRLVRGGVAQNDACPENMNRLLQADPDMYVANLARIMSHRGAPQPGVPD